MQTGCATAAVAQHMTRFFRITEKRPKKSNWLLFHSKGTHTHIDFVESLNLRRLMQVSAHTNCLVPYL